MRIPAFLGVNGDLVTVVLALMVLRVGGESAQWLLSLAPGPSMEDSCIINLILFDKQ